MTVKVDLLPRFRAVNISAGWLNNTSYGYALYEKRRPTMTGIETKQAYETIESTISCTILKVIGRLYLLQFKGIDLR